MKLISKEYIYRQVWSGIWKVYSVYYLFGFIVVYVHEHEPQFRSENTAINYIRKIKGEDAKDNS